MHACCRMAAKMGGTDLTMFYAILIFEIFTFLFCKLMKTVKPYNNPHARCRLAAKMGGTDLIVLYAILFFVIFTNLKKTHENCKTL